MRRVAAARAPPGTVPWSTSRARSPTSTTSLTANGPRNKTKSSRSFSRDVGLSRLAFWQHVYPGSFGNRIDHASDKPEAIRFAYVELNDPSAGELQSHTKITGSSVFAGPATISAACASWMPAKPGWRCVVMKRNSRPRNCTSTEDHPLWELNTPPGIGRLAAESGVISRAVPMSDAACP